VTASRPLRLAAGRRYRNVGRRPVAASSPRCPAGSSRAALSDNEDMLRVANLAVRAVLVVLVGFFTFNGRWPGAGYAAVQIGAFAAATILLVLLVPADRSPQARRRYALLLPYALGAITLMSGVASATPSGGTLIALGVIAAITAGSDTSLLAGWIVAGAGVLSTESTGLALGAGATVIIQYPILLVLGFVLGHNLRAHRMQAEQSSALLAKAEQLRQEQAKVATLDERTRIAREIHDVLAHSLGALGLHIELAQAVLADQHDEARAVELLDQARRMATDGLNETRRAVHALRGQTLPLPQGLAELIADHQRRHGARVTLGVTGKPRTLPPDAGLALTRTAQEALVNTAKHAPHQPVEIRLDYSAADTSLVVTNRLGENGRNDQQPGLATVNGGYGLAGLRERLLLLDGTLSAGRSGSDWVVVAKVPR
jgi:signal transduction histidine kinase